MDWLALSGRNVLVTGLKNKKSVAYFVGRALEEVGAHVLWSVHTSERATEVKRLVSGGDIVICDVADQRSIDALAADFERRGIVLAGLVHSIAFAEYTPKADGTPRAFHETVRADFLRAVDVSCFSLVALAQALESRFAAEASVVTISISTTRMASENYGYMAPIKAALDSSVVFLAKSFAARQVRFNAVNPGLLKTSASAGIPGYLDSYLFAESATLRKKAVQTDEVANAVLFLLSSRSAGINASSLVVDAGMSVNYFDNDIVKRATRVEDKL
ncbi:MAG: SDR family oxidoreductase [Planctomycetota bacterium]|nr:SDR family oxidoreductase [Planctomycetota bacterium]